MSTVFAVFAVFTAVYFFFLFSWLQRLTPELSALQAAFPPRGAAVQL
jgi:hypothetical protein